MNKKRTFPRLFLALLLVAGFLNPAIAQEKDDGPLLSEMKAFLVSLDKDGKEVLTPATEAEPEQVLEYQMTYSNIGKGPLQDLKINGPIPENTTYVDKSANTKSKHAFRVSIDGTKTWDTVPVKRIRLAPDGTKREVIVPPSEYTHVRWLVKDALKVKKKMQFNYRVKVN